MVPWHRPTTLRIGPSASPAPVDRRPLRVTSCMHQPRRAQRGKTTKSVSSTQPLNARGPYALGGEQPTARVYPTRAPEPQDLNLPQGTETMALQ